MKQVDKVLTDDHSRHDQVYILRIDSHFLCQHLFRLVYRNLIAIHKLFFCDDIVLSFLPENGVRKEISHQDHVFNIPVLQI